MSHKRAVTEADFRLPEFRTAKVEDYELRHGDDKPARKDRWETGIFEIADIAGLCARQGFEVSEVVTAVRRLVNRRDSWETENLSAPSGLIDLKLNDGSILVGATYSHLENFVTWRGQQINDLRTHVVAWRETPCSDLLND